MIAEALARLSRLDVGVPPRTDIGRAHVIAVHHIDRLAPAGLGGANAKLSRFVAAFRREPHAVVTPQAWAFDALVRRPVRGVDASPAPANRDPQL